METLPFRLTTYNGSEYKNSIYILNKGNNSGKPSLKPFRNSFVAICKDAAQVERVYMALQLLYRSRIYEYWIFGTAIPFIRLKAVKDVLLHNAHLFTCDELERTIQQVTLFEKQRLHYEKLVIKLQEIQTAYSRQFVKLNY
jgi:hypothetical protein